MGIANTSCIILSFLNTLKPTSYRNKSYLQSSMKMLFNKALILFCVAIFAGNSEICVFGKPQVPCIYIFGDSLVDNGNNNNLITQAKANYYPYGIDFPGGATGRFGNGRNVPDVLAAELGFRHPIPPFATARGSNILKGVNYGSGSAGIREETGKHMGDNISFNKQLSNHRITILRLLARQLNITLVNVKLSKCLYIVNTGSNDFLNNYFLPQYYLTSKINTPQQFVDSLIGQLSFQLKSLVDMKARHIAIFNLGPLGCIPASLARFPADQSGCVDSINLAVALYNSKLKILVDDLNFIGNLTTRAKFILINTTNLSLGINPVLLGITDGQNACCNVSLTFSFGQCIPGRTPCPNRNDHVYFDDFHPTEIINIQTARIALNAQSPLDAYPYDISHLNDA